MVVQMNYFVSSGNSCLIFSQLRVTVTPKTDDQGNTQCNTCYLQNKYKYIYPDFLVYS